MDWLDGYLDNLADAATSEKSILEQRMDNNETLVVANDSLFSATKVFARNIKSFKDQVALLTLSVMNKANTPVTTNSVKLGQYRRSDGSTSYFRMAEQY